MTVDDTKFNPAVADADHNQLPTADHNSSSSGDHSRHDVREFVDKLEHMPVGYAGDGGAAVEELPGVHYHMNRKLALSLVAMSFCWVGSQIPLYLYGSVLPDIYGEIGGANGRWVWTVIGYLIPNAALCPFVGALSDLFGRKWVAAFGQVCLIIGPVVVATAHHINVAIGGMVISGLGAGLNELIALAGTSELVPVRKRALYVGGVVFTILPFCPAPLYAELITQDKNWRYNGFLICGFNLLGLLLVVFFYKDIPKVRRPAKEVLREVDYIGGFLSTVGVVLFMMGLQWGAREYEWKSAHTLVPFLLGCAFIASFFVFEVKFAKHPMVPPRIFSRDKRTMAFVLALTFFSGGNFFVMLLFWPTQVYNVYGNDPLGIGIRTLPIGFGIIGGAVIALGLIGITRGKTRILMLFWSTMMTGFVGAMSAARGNNLIPTIYPILLFACMSVGAVIIPCSLIAQVICPTDLIGTITAITLSIRYIGGAVGFSVFYNVFFHKYYNLANEIAAPIVAQAGVTKDFYELITIVLMGSNSQYNQLRETINDSTTALIKGDRAYDIVIDGCQKTFVVAYQWPYWISIAFGGVCMILSFFLGNITEYMAEAF